MRPNSLFSNQEDVYEVPELVHYVCVFDEWIEAGPAFRPVVGLGPIRLDV